MRLLEAASSVSEEGGSTAPRNVTPLLSAQSRCRVEADDRVARPSLLDAVALVRGLRCLVDPHPATVLADTSSVGETSRAGADGRPHNVGSAADAQVLFALGLGIAALFHLAGNPRPSFAPPGIALTLVQLGVGAAALCSCFRPQAQLPLLLLCGLMSISAWLEAPVVGNHWVLAAALSTTYLIASVAGRRNEV